MNARIGRGCARVLLAIGLAGGVTAAAATGCGGGEKQVKKPRGKEANKINAKELLQQARSAAQKGDDERADKLYTGSYQKDPQVATMSEHVKFLINARRANRAVEVAKSYYDAHTSDTRGFALYAEALIEAGQAREALEVTDSMLQLDDTQAQFHALRGRALILGGKRDDGIDELRRALQMDGKDPVVLMALGEALLAARRIDEAALQLRSAVKLDPDNPRAYVLLGAALREQKEIEDAKATLKKAVDLDPTSGRPYFELGILHNQLSEQSDAEQALAKAVELDPEDTMYWYAYGEILRLRATSDPKRIDSGKLDLAIQAYKRALDINPPYSKAAGKLALSLVDANRHDEAEVLLTGILRADPNASESYFYLGVVYAHARKYKLAIDAYEKFLSLAPKSHQERERVKKAIQELRRKL